MKTNLKPYNPQLYTPSRKPLGVGDLGILLEHPRGYCVEVIAISGVFLTVRFLDSDIKSTRTYTRDEVIQTGKTALDLVKLYEPTPQSRSSALDIERSMPDFTQVRKKGGGGGKKKVDKPLTDFQKKFIAKLIADKLKELKGKKGD